MSKRTIPHILLLSVAWTAITGGFLFSNTQAAPVWGETLPLTQPDGSQIHVRIWGDEFYQIVESLDGYTLIRDFKTGFICFAVVAEDKQELLSTGVPVGQRDPGALKIDKHLRISPEAATAQAQAARRKFIDAGADWLLPPGQRDSSRATTIGNVVGICLLIDFPDEPGTISPSNVNDYCNLIGYSGYGNNGSVRDYYSDVSGGLLNYTNFVPTAYYTTLYNKAYYTNPSISYGTRAREMITEALNHLESTGFDFSLYDSNNDNVIDALNCFYAGYSDSAWAEGLWPHASSMTFCADGVCTNRYQITDLQSSLRLSTFCHENGHMLCGWPDLYDYDYDSNGVGQFCLMCFGTSGTNPCQPCAYMKYSAGWADLTLLETPATGLSVTGNEICKFSHPTHSNEYYLVENRQQTGRDSGLPDAGVAIYHVDTLGSNNHQQMTPELHYLVTLVQADGDWDLEYGVNSGDSTDLWAAADFTVCSPTTDPNTQWWDYGYSGLAITNIGASGTTMTFNFENRDCNDNGVLDADDLAVMTSMDCNDNDVPDECDIDWGLSEDYNQNGVPDECEDDVHAPEPNPAVLLTDPAYTFGSGPTEVTLTAQTATDDTPPIEYHFHCLSGDCNDRDWDTSPVYVDTGLSVNYVYVYRAQARDSATYPNATTLVDAPTVNIATQARRPGEPVLSPADPADTSITLELDVLDNPTWTLFSLQCTNSADAAWSGMFVSAAGTPSPTPVWQTNVLWGIVTVSGLQPGTEYTFTSIAQNLHGEETPPSPTASITTEGSSCAYGLGDMNGDAVVTGADVQCFVDCLLGTGGPCACACGDWLAPAGPGIEDLANFVDTLLGE